MQTNTRTSDRYRLTGNISRPPLEIGTRHLHINNEETFGFEIGKLGPEEIELVLHDMEIFSSLLQNHPTEMTEIVNNTLSGRTAEAVRLAAQIGMTEEAFQRSGGGPLFWIGIAIAAGVIFAYAACSSPPKDDESGEGGGGEKGGERLEPPDRGPRDGGRDD